MRLTHSNDDGMVWFKSQSKNNLWLEPCEMTAHDNRIAIKKLASYEDAEEQGRLVMLPCKVGDTVFYITGSAFYKAKAIALRINESGIRVYCERKFMGLIGFEGIYGKTVFLTREEAEAALKKGHDDV